MTDREAQARERAERFLYEAAMYMGGGVQHFTPSQATLLFDRLTSHILATMEREEALRAEVAQLRDDLRRMLRERDDWHERARQDGERLLRIDADWRKQWDDTIGKVARGEVLLQPPPPIYINDPSGPLTTARLARESAERERDEAVRLLERAVTYATEDRARTPRTTRLARLIDEARAFLARTPTGTEPR